MNNTIEQKRMEIDLIDADIVRLLNERYDACIVIGEAKKQGATAIFDPNREENIMKRLNDLAKYEGMIDTLWPVIMNFSKKLQSDL